MKRHHYLSSNTSKICKSTYCHNQLPFSPNDPLDTHFPKVFCCEEAGLTHLKLTTSRSLTAQSQTSKISRDFLSNHSGLLIDLEFERKLGDFENTLAFARNLGARQARGSILVFMDSDIISEKDFLQNLVSAHGHSEVVIPRRFHEVKLKSRFLNVMRKQYRSQDSYWLKFYKASVPMSEIEAPWRYVSGFCMSLKKYLFFEISGFSSSFDIYAFEDVDLAYQAFQRTNKFYLMGDIVIQQDHHVSESIIVTLKNKDNYY